MKKQVNKPNRMKSISNIGEAMLNSFIDIKQQAANGKKVLWVNGMPAFILARGLDMPIFHAEGFIAGLASKGLVKPLIDAGKKFGLKSDGCSYARAFIGLARIVNGDYQLEPSPLNDLYMMPKPDVYCNVPGGGCGTGRVWGDSVSTIFDIPVFHLQPRVNWDKKDLNNNLNNFITQQKEFITLLEKITGKSYDWELLKETMKEVKKALSIREEIMELCKSTPSPASFFDLVTTIGPICHLSGLPGSSNLLYQVKQEVKQRIKDGVGCVSNEKYRLYWHGIMTWPKLGELSRKFASLEASVVAGAYSHLLFLPDSSKIDPDYPLESLAHNMCDTAANYDFANGKHFVNNLCKEYSVDGAVISETQTCRGINISNFSLKNTLENELNIPTVSIGGDSCDDSFYSEAQVDTRLQALMETIKLRKKNES